MALPHIFTAISGFITNTASRIISIVAGKKLSGSPKKPTQPDNRQIKAELEYYRGKTRREQELLNIQADLAKMREIEIRAGMQIASAQAEREEKTLEISEKALKLRKQELDLAKARLQHDRKIADVQSRRVGEDITAHGKKKTLLAYDIRRSKAICRKKHT